MHLVDHRDQVAGLGVEVFAAVLEKGEVVAHRSPQDIMDEIAALDAEAAEVLATIRELL